MIKKTLPPLRRSYASLAPLLIFLLSSIGAAGARPATPQRVPANSVQASSQSTSQVQAALGGVSLRDVLSRYGNPTGNGTPSPGSGAATGMPKSENSTASGTAAPGSSIGAGAPNTGNSSATATQDSGGPGAGGASASSTSASPTLSVNPGTLDFGQVAVGSNNVLPLLITNPGPSQVMISQLSASGSGFSVSAAGLPISLGAGQSTSVSVTFSPSAAGNTSGSLSVISTAANSVATISLAGAGAHSVDLTWSASTTPGITGYDVYRGTTLGGPYTKLNTTIVQGTNYTDDTAQTGQTYYYVTTAVGSQNAESAYSNSAEAVIPAL